MQVIRIICCVQLILAGGCAAVVRAQGADMCDETEHITSLYFPTKHADATAQWFARRLCLLSEPTLAGPKRARPTRVVRCVYHWSFQPPLLARLDEALCELTTAKLDDSDEGPPRIERRTAKLLDCSKVVDAFIDNARRGGGGKRVAPNVVVVDGSEWFAEVADERGHRTALVDQPIEDPQRQQGVALACQSLMDASHIALPIAAPH